MRRGYRFTGRPGWILGHLLVLAAAVAMVFLGRWQLHVSEAKHFSLQNFGYALQWWAFAGFAVLMWLRVLRDHAREDPSAQPAEAVPAPEAPVAYRRYVMPQSARDGFEPADETHAAYNEYLARLARGETERT
ncbi:MAG: hypothetical protein EPN43_12940 [Jatrophihabitans sp.]|nr:MAG: hypothetical protein EPN43_12940 [Jatrophihabitans sp.]